MDYQQELQAKLDAVRSTSVEKPVQPLNTLTLEEHLINELEAEFKLAQYDLDESDILRSIKILDILNRYPEAFAHYKALSIFYALAKTGVIQAKNLYRLSNLPLQEFKEIITAMTRHKLLFVNADKELELSIEGQSLAERIGVAVFL